MPTQDADFPNDKSENYFVVFLQEEMNMEEIIDESMTLDKEAEVDDAMFDVMSSELKAQGPMLSNTADDRCRETGRHTSKETNKQAIGGI